jgi:hypothetical protein
MACQNTQRRWERRGGPVQVHRELVNAVRGKCPEASQSGTRIVRLASDVAADFSMNRLSMTRFDSSKGCPTGAFRVHRVYCFQALSLCGW